jgi:hypothetical protein
MPGRSLLARALRPRRVEPARVVLPSGLAEALRDGPVALRGDAASLADAPSLRVAAVVPSFRRGSGGHATIANLLRGLEAAGHRCDVWVLDDEGRHRSDEVDPLFKAFFGPLRGSVHMGLEGWDGADVALATHDPTLRNALLREMPGVGVEMLLGVRGEDAVALARRGVRVRIYVPYGEDWFRYAMRRWAESLGS